MKQKQVNARDFQKTFGQIAAQLQSGQSLRITKHGKPLGIFIKADSRRVHTPDFLANVQKHSYPVEVGNQALKQFHDSLS